MCGPLRSCSRSSWAGLFFRDRAVELAARFGEPTAGNRFEAWWRAANGMYVGPRVSPRGDLVDELYYLP